MRAKDIKRVLIIGSGTMGQQIGFLSAVHGCEVRLHDVDENMGGRAMKRIEGFARKFASSGRLKEEDDVPQVLGRIFFSTNAAESAQDVDFVSESVFEDPKLKGEVFARFNELCPKRAVFTTNTSTLLPSMFADATGRPASFAAFHFHNVMLNSVVDIMPHLGTSFETMALIRDFAERLDLIPIVMKKESSGYVFNAMFKAWLNAAQTLVANDVASFEDVDRAWMGVMSYPLGPFGIMDSIGLDTVFKIGDFWAQETQAPQDRANADLIKKYIDQGYLGVKEKRGFYTYPQPAFMQPDFLSGRKKNEE